MAETLLYQGVAVNPANGLRVRLGHNEETLSGTKTLVPQDAQFQLLDPDGNKDVLLPREEESQGLWFVIKNMAGGAEEITVKEDSDTTTIDVLGEKEFGIFVCDGSSWVSAVGEVAFDPS